MTGSGAEAFTQVPDDIPKGSAGSVFLRILRYTLKYKWRTILSVLFALSIAASYGTTIAILGPMINVTFYTPRDATSIAAGAPVESDPAQPIARHIANGMSLIKDTLGWAPQGLDQWFLSAVDRMRQQRLYALWVLCLVAVAMTFFVSVARFFQEYLAGSVCANITTDLQREMFANIVRQPMGFFESHASGEILSRFANDAFVVTQEVMSVLVKLMREPFIALALFIVAVSVDTVLTVVGMCVLPPIFYVLVLIGRKVRRSMRRSLQRIAAMVSIISEAVRGIIIVKGYDMEQYEIDRVSTEVSKLRRYLHRLVRLDAAAGPLTGFMLTLGVVVFVLLSGYRVASGELQPGGLMQLYVALALMLDPVRKLSNVNNIIQKSAASAERVFEFIDLKPSIVEAPGAVDLPPFREGIRFENVCFSYNGRNDVLKGIDLEVRKGEIVALVGFSGAGKSTLVKLIPRFYDVTGGSIKIDGVDIRQATFKSLREKISIVTQDTILFAESIRNNIAYGQRAYNEKRISEAAQAAHAVEFIEQLEHGFDTVIGEAGCTLSGGQRQRLAIARAIIKDPAILILDEATSSLDSESERLIQDALDHFVAGRTAIVIAHRLSTVQRADRIIVLDDGRIAEQGPHQELLARGGIYGRLHEIQFGLQKDGA
jgi:subfamily B ATP-binding cassette protein MsbA